MYDLGVQFHKDITSLISKRGAIVMGNKYRFTVLTERLIRLEYCETGSFNDRQTQLVNFRDFSIPKYFINQNDTLLEIKTDYFTLSYVKESDFRKRPKDLTILLNDTDNVWFYGHPEARNYYGSNVSVETKNESAINKGLYSIDGFVSIDESNSIRFDENGTIIHNDGQNADIYVFLYNKDFGFCIQDYLKLTGMPALIPRYALGNWWSKDDTSSANDYENLINTFYKNGIPLSILLLGKSWRTNVVGGYSFNPNLFQNPKYFIDRIHSYGIKLGVNINPGDGISPNEPNYSEAIKYISFNQKTSMIEFDPLNPKFLDVYFKIFIKPLEDLGVDFFWNDYADIKDLNKLWIMNHYHHLDMEKVKTKRGMILSRNPLVASHRYPILYSGETKVSWDNFKKLPFFSISASNIAVSWWSHDVGGFSGGIEEDDLYVRSVELGVFSPILRFHSKAGKYYKKEPWKWNYKTKSIVSDYLRLRHRLIPYLYSEAYQYHKNGRIIFQPVYYLVPKLYDDSLYRNEYFFGSQLLVAPIINKKEPLMNRTIHRFYLPAGIWYDYTTGKKFLGNKKYVSFFKDEDYPVFAKQGAIIPLSNKSNINNISNPTLLEIQIFPGQSNSFELYEDDGFSQMYKDGFYLKTLIDYNYMKNNYTVIIRTLEGKKGIVPEKRNYKMRFKNTKKAEEVLTYFNEGTPIQNNCYIDGNDFIVEINDVESMGQLTINCKGTDIEIDAVRLINEDIDSILMDLLIETELKEEINKILSSEESLNKKRISLRKLKRKGLDKSFINLFLKLLEYAEQI